VLHVGSVPPGFGWAVFFVTLKNAAGSADLEGIPFSQGDNSLTNLLNGLRIA